MKFQYFRFFLSPIDGNLFSQIPDSRENAIKTVFNNNYDDYYRGMNYSIRYVNQIENIVCFKIAKHTSIKRNKSPEENFEPEQVDHWPYIHMIIGLCDKINNTHGQIIAVEHKPSVIKSPITILRHWADKRNEDLYKFGYVLSINPISYKKSFWNIVNQYKGQIEELVFEYSMPNLFNTGDSLEQDLKNANKNFNATQAKIVFTNKNGSLSLSENNTLLQQSADYVDNGGGEFKIKKKGESSYIMSAKTIKTQNVDIEDLNIETKTPKAMLDILNKVLELNE